MRQEVFLILAYPDIRLPDRRIYFQMPSKPGEFSEKYFSSFDKNIFRIAPWQARTVVDLVNRKTGVYVIYYVIFYVINYVFLF